MSVLLILTVLLIVKQNTSDLSIRNILAKVAIVLARVALLLIKKRSNTEKRVEENIIIVMVVVSQLLLFFGVSPFDMYLSELNTRGQFYADITKG